MKAIKCRLLCFTRWGYECESSKHQSIKEAVELAKELCEDDYAFSYEIFSEDGTKLLKRGVKQYDSKGEKRDSRGDFKPEV